MIKKCGVDWINVLLDCIKCGIKGKTQLKIGWATSEYMVKGKEGKSTKKS